MIRIGQGFDIHQTIKNRPLRLGGVTIPADFGLKGHSDADVLLHAIIDALLGALALGDIGQWFPDNDQKFKNINSVKLLEEVLRSPQLSSWRLVNLDSTILAESPKLAPYICEIRKTIAKLFASDIEQISVKATTMEKLDSIGQKKAIAAQVIILLEKS